MASQDAEPNRPAGRLRRLFFGLVIAAFTIGACLGVGELVVRIFLPQNMFPHEYVSSERYGYLMKPGIYTEHQHGAQGFVTKVKTNSHGFRDEEWTASELADPRITKVLLLGDSYIFGSGVQIEDRLDAKLQLLLAKAGLKARTINVAQVGWGAMQEFTYARDHFSEIRPDVVVFTFCPNDPRDDALFEMNLKDYTRGHVWLPGKAWLRQHSHLYKLLFNKFNRLATNLTYRWRALFRSTAAAAEAAVMNIGGPDSISEEMWRVTLERIRAFHQDFLAFNPSGVLLVQTSHPVREDVRQHLRTLSSGANLVFVDLFDDVKELKPDQWVTPHDGHWSPLMYSISAKRVAAAILAAKGPMPLNRQPGSDK